MSIAALPTACIQSAEKIKGIIPPTNNPAKWTSVGQLVSCNHVFIETEIARFCCEDELWTAYLEIEDVEDPDFLDLPEEEQRRYFMETFESLVFYRFTGEKIPGSVEDALKLIGEISFWPPEYIWLNGKLCETYGAPATDQDGNIVGVRF